MPSSTTRGAIPLADPADNRKNVRLDLNRVAQRLADAGALFLSGTAAARPSPATNRATFYIAEDTGAVTLSTGAAWLPVTLGAHEAATDPHPGYVLEAGGSTITTSALAVKGLVVKGSAGQTANLAEFQSSTGAVLAGVDAAGTFVGTDVRALRAAYAGGNAATGGVPFLNAALQVAPLDNSPSQRALVVRGAASQTANLAEFQNSAGTVLAGVTAAGSVSVTDSTSSGLQRALQFGAADSAGAGFRAVRVAN